MSEFPAPAPATAHSAAGGAAPPASCITLAHLVYGLFLFGCLTTITWWFPVASLITLAWIGGLVLAYVKRGEAEGTWLETHYRWQIRTFWFGLLWTVIGWVLVWSFIGIVIGIPLLLVVTGWLIYRILRGWFLLNEGKPIPAS